MSVRLDLSVQYACGRAGLPLRKDIFRWIKAALAARGGKITLRFVDLDEAKELNEAFRGKAYATNVLSFPYETLPVVFGDLAICQAVVEKEAAEQQKTLEAHYAHLIIHGVLHLLGFDHELSEDDANRMEQREREILLSLDFNDPYAEEKEG